MAKKPRNGTGSKKIEAAPKPTFDVSRETHQLSRNNTKLIKKSKQVGCFFCLKIYLAKDVKNYRDNANHSAICSFCSVDSLIPDASGIELTEAFLKAMRDKWFNF